MLEALCATTRLPEDQSWLCRGMNYLARQRGSSKNLWDYQVAALLGEPSKAALLCQTASLLPAG